MSDAVARAGMDAVARLEMTERAFESVCEPLR